MAVTFLRFDSPNPSWTDGGSMLRFEGNFGGDTIEFLVTARAVADMLGPNARFMREDNPVRTYREAEGLLHRYAHREWSNLIGKSRTVTLTHAVFGD
ncbi:MAG TPA: hypothetical protein VF509_03625 [Sphingobium sp.]